MYLLNSQASLDLPIPAGPMIEIKRALFGITIREHHNGDFDHTEGVDGIVGTDGDRVGRDKMLGKERGLGVEGIKLYLDMRA